MTQAPDGGYLLAGGLRKNASQWYDGWLARLDDNGRLIWEKQFGGLCDDWFSAVVSLPNGDIMLAGGSDPDDNPNHSDAWLVRLNKDGERLWQRRIKKGDDASVNAVVLTGDGETLLVGRCTATVDGPSLGWVARLDAAGVILWEQNFGSEFKSVHPVSGGGFLVSGQSCSEMSGADTGCVALLAGLDNQGGVLWQHETPKDYRFNDLLSAYGGDGRLLFAGHKGDFSADHSTKLLFLQPGDDGARGMILPQKFDGMAQDLIATREGGYAMVGWHSVAKSMAGEGWFMVFDGQGQLVRELSLEDEPDALLQDRDGEFLLSGSRINGNNTGWWVSKLTRSGHEPVPNE